MLGLIITEKTLKEEEEKNTLDKNHLHFSDSTNVLSEDDDEEESINSLKKLELLEKRTCIEDFDNFNSIQEYLITNEKNYHYYEHEYFEVSFS